MTTCDETGRPLTPTLHPHCRFAGRGGKRGCTGVAALFILIAPFATAGVARAQAEDQATARALFEQARGLMKAGQYAAACPKLEAARKLYTSAGILLNLADCHEKIGKTATAWTEFGEAVTVAARSNRPEDADEAARRKAALEPSLARIVIRVATPTPGLVVKRDGAILADATWGLSLPVDPGAHSVNADAPGFESWSTSITIAAAGKTETIDVPELKPSAVAGTAAKPADASAAPAAGGAGSLQVTATPEARSSNVLPWTLVGAGAAVAIGGGVLMLVESGRASTARTNNDPAAWDATQTPWKIGLVGALVGVASAATGGVLLAMHGKDAGSASGSSSSSVHAFTWVSGGAGGVALTGSW